MRDRATSQVRHVQLAATAAASGERVKGLHGAKLNAFQRVDLGLGTSTVMAQLTFINGKQQNSYN